MIKVGITGQSGFIGRNLFNYLGLKENIERIPFKDDYFENNAILQKFVKQCNIIIHLAAVNRHADRQVIYDTNIRLIKELINACENSRSKPFIIFSSSTQEEKDNIYGKSKFDGRRLFEKWAIKNNGRFTSLLIPNVFGPFGNPYYNSVIATFSHQLTHNEQPEIHVDGLVKLIYVNELIEIFYKFISKKLNTNHYKVPHTSEKKVSEILKILKSFKISYYENGIMPDISDSFKLALFNTFRSYIPDQKLNHSYIQHSDDRGIFVEVLRTNSPGQFSFSSTKPGITRGNHYHLRKVERFAVIQGKAIVALRKIGTDQVLKYELNGSNTSYIDIPIWFTHNITNIGEDDLITLFWVNEPYNPDDSDTFYETV